MTTFLPRLAFPSQLSLPRSYFLGHHASGLSKMKTMLSSIDLIIECRDYRVPLTSRNPLFEQLLSGRERLVIYTKADLGRGGRAKEREENRMREQLLRDYHLPSSTLFTSHTSKRDIKSVLSFAKSYSEHNTSLLGTRILVVGMPNVGKSSLLNALRLQGVHRAKAAHTGAQPGITRKIASGVKIVDKEEGVSEGIYLVDTPGVFVPFVPDTEAMLKLALVGSVKDTIIAPVTLCDYLLYCINKNEEWGLYGEYSEPTNDVQEFLEGVCRKSGRLGKGGVPDLDAAALWIIQRWRQGLLGNFVLDDVSTESLEKDELSGGAGTSLSQARKMAKEAQRARGKARLAAGAA